MIFGFALTGLTGIPLTCKALTYRNQWLHTLPEFIGHLPCLVFAIFTSIAIICMERGCHLFADKLWIITKRVCNNKNGASEVLGHMQFGVYFYFSLYNTISNGFTYCMRNICLFILLEYSGAGIGLNDKDRVCSQYVEMVCRQ